MSNKDIETHIYHNEIKLSTFLKNKLTELDSLSQLLVFSKYEEYIESRITDDSNGVVFFVGKTRSFWTRFFELNSSKEKDISFLGDVLIAVTPENFRSIVKSKLYILENVTTEEKDFVFSSLNNNIKFSLRYIENNRGLFDFTDSGLHALMNMYKVKIRK
jgi:hypothetical protein